LRLVNDLAGLRSAVVDSGLLQFFYLISENLHEFLCHHFSCLPKREGSEFEGLIIPLSNHTFSCLSTSSFYDWENLHGLWEIGISSFRINVIYTEFSRFPKLIITIFVIEDPYVLLLSAPKPSKCILLLSFRQPIFS